VSEVNRAFSAGGVFLISRSLGRCPRLEVNAAPLALNTCSAFAGRKNSIISASSFLCRVRVITARPVILSQNKILKRR
jgi:hypothetical protein